MAIYFVSFPVADCCPFHQLRRDRASSFDHIHLELYRSEFSFDLFRISNDFDIQEQVSRETFHASYVREVQRHRIQWLEKIFERLLGDLL